VACCEDCVLVGWMDGGVWVPCIVMMMMMMMPACHEGLRAPILGLEQILLEGD
jgi:hypothetical protein